MGEAFIIQNKHLEAAFPIPFFIKNWNKYAKFKFSFTKEKAENSKNNSENIDVCKTENKNIPLISALLITHNEERNIQQYLNEVEIYAEEIIVVDSESTDKTPEIAKQHPKVKFFTREFDNFTQQKKFAIEKAKNEWITFFDADERISQDLIDEMLDAVKHDKADTFFIFRRFYFKDKYIKYSAWQNDKAIRLFKKSKNKYDENRLVHETIISSGRVAFLNNKLDHYSYSSVKEYKDKLTHYSRLKARELFNKKVKPNFIHFNISPAFRFAHHYIFRFGILDGKEGFVIAKLHAESIVERYMFLSEMWKNEDKNQ